jgi:hypothetical protein
VPRVDSADDTILADLAQLVGCVYQHGNHGDRHDDGRDRRLRRDLRCQFCDQDRQHSASLEPRTDFFAEHLLATSASSRMPEQK